jgi:phosphoribosyl 1,2-cyclic phosphodiesterase
MRVVSLGSSSSGNALLVEAGPEGRTKILIDAGLNGRTITERLRRVGISPAQLTAILLTHEHSDHVQGVPLLLKRYAVPLIADLRTFKAIERGISQGIWYSDAGTPVLIKSEETNGLPVAQESANYYSTGNGQMPDAGQLAQEKWEAHPHLAQALPVGSQCRVDDIEVTSFPISHDAVAPCGYLLSAGGCRVCLVTDSGEVTPEMLTMMNQADLLVLEANHDRQRLVRGPYPQSLKQRILSSTGHLSNDQAADALLHIWRPDSVRWVWLSHLSRTNNTPSLAVRSIKDRLVDAGATLAQIHITASPPDLGGIWDSTKLWSTSSMWDMS